MQTIVAWCEQLYANRVYMQIWQSINIDSNNNIIIITSEKPLQHNYVLF